jgi:hypothetical protein
MNDAAARMGRQMARRSSRLPLGIFHFDLSPIQHIPHSRSGSLRLFPAKYDPYGVTNLFPFAVVSFGLQCPSRNESYRLDGTSHPSGSRSAGKRELLSSATPVPSTGTQKIFGSRPCPIGGLQSSWLLANPSWLTAWAVKTLMTFIGSGGWNG